MTTPSSRQRDKRASRDATPTTGTEVDPVTATESPAVPGAPVPPAFTPAQMAVLRAGGTVAGWKFVNGQLVQVDVSQPAPYTGGTAGWYDTPISQGGGAQPVYDGPLAPNNPTAPNPPAAPTTPTPTGPTQAEKDAAAQRENDARAAKEAKDKSDRDSAARLNGVLGEYGLSELADTVWGWIVEGLSEAEIIQRMRGTDTYKKRFVGMEERRKKGLAPISERDYINYERDARQLFRAAGLPTGFYDSNDDFTKFLANDLSISELSDRVTLAANAAFRMPKEDRDALTQWGMGPGDLTAFWLDPDKAQPLLERKYAAAQLAGTSKRSGFGDLNEDTATGLATMGVTQQQAQQGFGTLVESRELFGALDSGEDTIDQNAQLDAAFRGSTNAQRRIEQRRRRRQGVFEAGGGFASAQNGLTGLGDTDGM